MPAKRKSKPRLIPITINYLKKRGICATRVEGYNAFTKRTRDTWGADILAYKKEESGAMLIQVTSWANVSTRVKKILEIPEGRDWMGYRARQFWIFGWKKIKNRWRCKILVGVATETFIRWDTKDAGL